MNDPLARIVYWLTFLYGKEKAAEVAALIFARVEQARTWNKVPSSQEKETGGSPIGRKSGAFTERDAILITYGDQFREPGRPPLQTLRAFLNKYMRDAINGVHILPCFPYSSDDGFAVIDYRRIDPALGDWDDVTAIGRSYRLMLDLVANHVSRQNAWFQAFLRNEAPYKDYFIVLDPATDLSQVVRPRPLPLLTPVATASGTRYVWTTFSDDQVDLNYATPQVLLEMTDVLLHYVARGAEIIRLDAIAYLWKEIGTPCIHLPQTHAVVKLWRAVLDAVAPHILLITETNVPHAENISYFGEPLSERGTTDEAQMVYNFSLAPLILHALQTGDATRLSRWAAVLKPPAPGATFFNFIASHDGIGVLPARGILSEAEVQGLVEQTLAHGGRVSYKADPDGSTGVYELNTTLYDFLNDPAHPEPDRDVARFLAAQVILLSLVGVPGIYVHSLFGSRNCHDCFAATGRARSLNRHKFNLVELETILADPTRHERRVFDAYRRLLRLRRAEQAFHPAGGQHVLNLGPAIFAVLRTPPGTGRPILCLVNVSPHDQTITLPADIGGYAGPSDPLSPQAGPSWPASHLGQGVGWRDLIADAVYGVGTEPVQIKLSPYQACWLALV